MSAAATTAAGSPRPPEWRVPWARPREPPRGQVRLACVGPVGAENEATVDHPAGSEVGDAATLRPRVGGAERKAVQRGRPEFFSRRDHQSLVDAAPGGRRGRARNTPPARRPTTAGRGAARQARRFAACTPEGHRPKELSNVSVSVIVEPG